MEQDNFVTTFKDLESKGLKYKKGEKYLIDKMKKQHDPFKSSIDKDIKVSLPTYDIQKYKQGTIEQNK